MAVRIQQEPCSYEQKFRAQCWALLAEIKRLASTDVMSFPQFASPPAICLLTGACLEFDYQLSVDSSALIFSIAPPGTWMKRFRAVFVFLCAALCRAPLPKPLFTATTPRTRVYLTRPKQFTGVKWMFKTAGPNRDLTSNSNARGLHRIPCPGTCMPWIAETGKEKWKLKSRMRLPLPRRSQTAPSTSIRRISGLARPQDWSAKMGVCHRVRARV